MVTKKDFNKIAEIIERNIPQGPFVIAEDLVMQFRNVVNMSLVDN